MNIEVVYPQNLRPGMLLAGTFNPAAPTRPVQPNASAMTITDVRVDKEQGTVTPMFGALGAGWPFMPGEMALVIADPQDSLFAGLLAEMHQIGFFDRTNDPDDAANQMLAQLYRSLGVNEVSEVLMKAGAGRPATEPDEAQDGFGWISGQMDPEDIETALNTLAEVWSVGLDTSDLSIRQVEVAERVHELWALDGDAPDDDTEIDRRELAADEAIDADRHVVDLFGVTFDVRRTTHGVVVDINSEDAHADDVIVNLDGTEIAN